MAISLPRLPSVGDLLKLYGVRALQQLGQNFLLDSKLTDRIVASAGDLTSLDAVIEIGAGPGGLTRSVVRHGAKNLFAVEIDKRFLPGLELLAKASEKNTNMFIVNDDVLKLNEKKMLADVVKKRPWTDDGPAKVIANLPFNIATPLLLKYLRDIASQSGLFSYGRTELTLMFQADVGEKMVSLPEYAQAGRLSVVVQALCEVEQVFVIKGNAFVPPPDVDAAVMSLIPRVKPLSEMIVEDFEIFNRTCSALFNSQRKCVLNCVRHLVGRDEKIAQDILRRSGIEDPYNKRPHGLTMKEIDRIAYYFNEHHLAGRIYSQSERLSPSQIKRMKEHDILLKEFRDSVELAVSKGEDAPRMPRVLHKEEKRRARMQKIRPKHEDV